MIPMYCRALPSKRGEVKRDAGQVTRGIDLGYGRNEFGWAKNFLRLHDNGLNALRLGFPL